VKTRFQNLPFKFNLQRYTSAYGQTVGGGHLDITEPGLRLAACQLVPMTDPEKHGGQTDNALVIRESVDDGGGIAAGWKQLLGGGRAGGGGGGAVHVEPAVTHSLKAVTHSLRSPGCSNP
jgi:hypothetical protein